MERCYRLSTVSGVSTRTKSAGSGAILQEVVAPQAGESVEQAKQAFYAAYPLPSTNEIDRSQSATQNIQHTYLIILLRQGMQS